MSATPQPTRFPRPAKTLSDSKVPLNIEMEAELTCLLGCASGEAGLAQLLDPQGRRDIICRTGFAVRWCAVHSDWAFEAL